MRRGILLLLAILIFVQMASANPGDSSLSQFPDDSTGSYYDDPDDLLDAFCDVCHIFIRDCFHSQQRGFVWLGAAPFDTASFIPDISSHAYNTHTYPHSAPAGPEPERPFFEHLVEPPREEMNNPHSANSWLDATYTVGDRQENRNPLLLESSNVPLLERHGRSELGSPAPSVSESQTPSYGSTRKRGPPVKNGFPCNACSDIFDRNADLNRHWKTKHLTEKPNKCERCERTFLYPKDLRRHILTHLPSESNYLCPYEDCKSGFTRKDNLHRHMRKQHSMSSLNTARSVSGASTN